MSQKPPSTLSRCSRAEAWWIGFFLLAAAVMRVVYAGRFRIDSDELQHLHVVWGWANGKLPYRDLFDNHMPLFQMLSAPLFKLLGVRADILIPMRLALFPIYGLCVWCVGAIVAEISSAQAGWWSAVLAAWIPPFFLTSLEFRPDQLWTLFWLLALLVAVRGEWSVKRAFGVGLLLGLAFAVSMKSTLMIAALALAVGGLAVLRFIPARARWLDSKAAGLGGLLIAPALIVAFFIARGAGPKFYECVIRHNMLPDNGEPGHLLRHVLRWLAMLLVVLGGAAAIRRWADGRVGRIVFVWFATGLYFITLQCFWPILTDEDYLPFYPLLAGLGSVWIFAILPRCLPRISAFAPLLASLAVAGEIAWCLVTNPPRNDAMTDKIGMIADTLRLTAPTDYVMDSKGETIYRERPFYYVLEGLTKRRLKRGLIADDIAAKLIATGTPLATDRRMPEDARDFIKENYLPIAFRLRVPGKDLYLPSKDDSVPRPAVLAFDVAVPGRYTILSKRGTIFGTLNGTPFDAPRELAAGHYEFRATGGEGRVVLVWAHAIEAGYSPFAAIKPDYTTPQD